jgi:hypothetical protein
MTMRCSTSHGTYRCDREHDGHDGECETAIGPRATPNVVDLDSRRELAKAAARIVVLTKALEEIRDAPCDAPHGGTSCLCCFHDRLIAMAALAALDAAPCASQETEKKT